MRITCRTRISHIAPNFHTTNSNTVTQQETYRIVTRRLLGRNSLYSILLESGALIRMADAHAMVDVPGIDAEAGLLRAVDQSAVIGPAAPAAAGECAFGSSIP